MSDIGVPCPPMPTASAFERSIWMVGAIGAMRCKLDWDALRGFWHASVSFRGVACGAWDASPLMAVEKLAAIVRHEALSEGGLR